MKKLKRVDPFVPPYAVEKYLDVLDMNLRSRRREESEFGMGVDFLT